MIYYSDAEQKQLEAARARRAELPRTPITPQPQPIEKKVRRALTIEEQNERSWRSYSFGFYD